MMRATLVGALSLVVHAVSVSGVSAASAQTVATSGDVAILQTVEELTVTQDPETGARVERLSPPDSVVPGDMLRYTLTVTNPTAAPVEEAVLTLALPAEVVLLEDTATEGGAEAWRVTYSVDGGTSFAARNALEVFDAETGVMRPALSDDIDTVRWEASTPLAPGGTSQVSLDGLLS